MDLKTIKEANIQKGQRVLVRADFDVAMEKGRVKEDFRLRAILPTVKFISKKGGLVRLAAHLDRPGGKAVPDLSFKKISPYLARLLKRRVVFIDNPFSDKLFTKYNYSKEILFFENMRFWPGEEADDEKFAKDISKWGDIYVNEAFASSHRKHASIFALAKILPSFAGLALEKEIKSLSLLVQDPVRPFFAILGGAKLETKLPLIRTLLKIADGVIIGGALVKPLKDFLENKNSNQDGSFKTDKDFFKNSKLYLPKDVRVSNNPNFKGRIADPENLLEGEAILDIGPEAVDYFTSLLKKARTIVWNGPMGLAEKKEFAYGTVEIGKSLQKIRAFKAVGGGDTVAILHKYRLLKGFNHISLGGGAMLEFLSGEKLPGLEVLKK